MADEEREERGQDADKDRHLPSANIMRIMKRVLPDSGKINKDARDSVQECVSEFICFVTSEASEKCKRDKRKTISGQDIIDTLLCLGFDNYADALLVYYDRYKKSLHSPHKQQQQQNQQQQQQHEQQASYHHHQDR